MALPTALTGEELADEVQAATGREDDTVLITVSRITRWLNKAQRIIAEKCPDLLATHFVNTTSLDTSTQLKYAIADITVNSTADVSETELACYVTDVYYLDGLNSRKLEYKFPDELDEAYPDPTHSDVAKDRPTLWTRRGNYIEMFPLCLTAYCDKDLRFDGSFYPSDFSADTTELSDLSRADEGLIFYATAKAWGAIGNEEKRIMWDTRWKNWLGEYEEQSGTLHEWDGHLYGSVIE